MHVDWSNNVVPLGIFPRFDASGPVPIILFRRISPAFWLDVIAEIDENVRNAVFLETPNGGVLTGCDNKAPDLRDGYYAFNLHGDDEYGTSHARTGGFGGRVDDAFPKVLGAFDDGRGVEWYVSKYGFARGDPITWEIVFRPWSVGAETLVASPATDPDGLASSRPKTPI